MRIPFAAGIPAALAVLALACATASAHDFKAGDLTIEHPWARATPAGAQVAGGYLTVVNRGGLPDRLVGGSLEAAGTFELHQMSMDGGVMRMRPAGALDIPAGGTVTLAPSGGHIMFTGLRRGLKTGQAIEGTLVFEHAGTVPVQFLVESVGAKGPGKSDVSDHAGPAMPGMDMN